MSSAKDEIAEYLPSTSFGKDKPKLVRDKPVARPKTRGEAIRQVEEAFRYCRWDESDKRRNASMIGLEFKPPREYSNEELKIILDDFEKFAVIIYGN